MALIRLKKVDIRIGKVIGNRKMQVAALSQKNRSFPYESEFIERGLADVAVARCLEVEFDGRKWKDNFTTIEEMHPHLHKIKPFLMMDGKVTVSVDANDEQIVVVVNQVKPTWYNIIGYISVKDAKKCPFLAPKEEYHKVSISQLGKATDLIKSYEIYKITGRWQ